MPLEDLQVAPPEGPRSQILPNFAIHREVTGEGRTSQKAQSNLKKKLKDG